MTKQEQYNLEFSRNQMPGFADIFICRETTETVASNNLSSLLYSLGVFEGPMLLEEINYALNNLSFEEYYSVDASTLGDGVQIIPPNAIINQKYEISLIELRSLVEEWVAFTSS